LPRRNENPVTIRGRVEFLGAYQLYPTAVVLLFGNNNRVMLTPVLDQVTEPGIFARLGIP
jgi:hypothetical protein